MTAMPTHCTDCERPLRDKRTTLEDAPGTITYGGNGRCNSCRNKHNAKKPRKTHCDQCGVPVRSGPRQGPDDESVYYAGNGECANCRKRRQTAERNGTTLDPLITPEQHAYNVMVWNAFVAERRKRNVPVDGWHVEGNPELTMPTATDSPVPWPQRRRLAALLQRLEHEQAAIAADTRAQEARHRNEYGTAA